MTHKKPISEILRENRKAKGWLQKEAADSIGVKRCTYASYEENRAQPSVDTIFRAAEAFGYHSIDEFLQLQQEPES